MFCNQWLDTLVAKLFNEFSLSTAASRMSKIMQSMSMKKNRVTKSKATSQMCSVNATANGNTVITYAQVNASSTVFKKPGLGNCCIKGNGQSGKEYSRVRKAPNKAHPHK